MHGRGTEMYWMCAAAVLSALVTSPHRVYAADLPVHLLAHWHAFSSLCPLSSCCSLHFGNLFVTQAVSVTLLIKLVLSWCIFYTSQLSGSVSGYWSGNYCVIRSQWIFRFVSHLNSRNIWWSTFYWRCLVSKSGCPCQCPVLWLSMLSVYYKFIYVADSWPVNCNSSCWNSSTMSVCCQMFLIGWVWVLSCWSPSLLSVRLSRTPGKLQWKEEFPLCVAFLIL